MDLRLLQTRMDRQLLKHEEMENQHEKQEVKEKLHIEEENHLEVTEDLLKHISTVSYLPFGINFLVAVNFS
jgi:hypothetical protein